MNVLSVCSGIDAASVAWQPLGYNFVGFSEIEPFPRSVLEHHHPNIPVFGDFTEIQHGQLSDAINVLVGGTPCQSFSLAGLRGGLDDNRGNLALQFCRLALRTRPRWVVWENVPGVFSSWTDDPDSEPEQQEDGTWNVRQTNDFDSFLKGLEECGYRVAYRVLDAQYVRVESHGLAVPQRRRRVFVVGYLGDDWRPPAAVLFERQGLFGHPAPRRKAGERVAGTIASRASAGGGLGTDFECDGVIAARMTAFGEYVVDGSASTIKQRDHKDATDLIAFSCKDSGQDAVLNSSPTLRAMNNNSSQANGGGQIAIAFAQNQRDEVRIMDVAGALAAEPGMKQQTFVGVTIHGTDKTSRVASYTDVAGALRTKPPGSIENSSTTVVQNRMQVRRLTPLECERLQGFPDHYTKIKYWGKTARDSPRYKAVGNSMAVNVMSWIGQRIQQVDRMVVRE